MANLNRRRNFSRPLEEHEVDHNWDELDRRTKTGRELDTIEKISEFLETTPPGTSSLQQVLQKGNCAGGMKITGLSEGTQPGDAVAFEQINIDENVNPLQTYNDAAGN